MMLASIADRMHSQAGQGLGEYALIVGGVALAATVGVAILGEGTADWLASLAPYVPGLTNYHECEQVNCQVVEIVEQADGGLVLSATTVVYINQRQQHPNQQQRKLELLLTEPG